MDDSKISIIVPIYNAEKYLKKCIKSLISQTYRNLEIILVNDGSIDGSLDICKDYSTIDSRILVIDKINGGVSSARNKGLEIATGDFIGFVDSDDYIDKRMYEKLLLAIKENSADIAECGYCTTDANYNVVKKYPLDNSVVEGSYQCSLDYLALSNTTNFNVNKLYRRTILKDIRYPDFKYSEDFWVNVRAFYKCKKKVTISGCYYYYFKNGNSACNRPFTKEKLDAINAGKDVFEFYKQEVEELCPYVALYISEHVVRLFRELKASTFTEKMLYKNMLIAEFKKYYPLICGEVYNNIKYTKRHISLLLFKIKPELYYILYKFFQKVKKNSL